MKYTSQPRLILRYALTGLVSLLFALVWAAGCAAPTGTELTLKDNPTPTAAATSTAAVTPTNRVILATQTQTQTQTLVLSSAMPTVENSATPLPTQAAPPPAPAQACQAAGGKIVSQSMPTNLLSAPLDFNVYLPPCYVDNPTRRYPVLYLLHGQAYTDDQWIRLGATTTADRLIANGDISPFLIVMPNEKEWLPPDQTKFGDVLVDVLVPWIDQQYRTLPERNSRAIGGLSRGAAWAVHLGLTRWETFGAIGAHSLPIFWTDSSQIGGWLDAIPAGSMPRIYLDIGRSDTELSSAMGFEDLLNARNIPHEWHLQPGYHTEEYWQAHVEEYLRWYAADW